MPELPEIETIKSVIAGIENIYFDEILFQARIYPARPANSLTPEDYLETKGQVYPNGVPFYMLLLK